LANPRKPNRKKFNRLVYLIPAIALLGVAIVYVVGTLPPPSAPAAMNFEDQIVIQMTNNDGSQVLPNIMPAYATRPIGETGGYWATTEFNSYEVNAQHYPLYMDIPAVACPSVSCVIHVKSRVNYNYTLGDFFAVWGEPLGQNNTVGIPRTTNKYGTFAWEMCVGPTGDDTPFIGPYNSLVLQSQMDITLIFYNTTNGVGCA
jgi:hypothetical protein